MLQPTQKEIDDIRFKRFTQSRGDDDMDIQAKVDAYNAELKAMRHQAPSEQALAFARTLRKEDEKNAGEND